MGIVGTGIWCRRNGHDPVRITVLLRGSHGIRGGHTWQPALGLPDNENLIGDRLIDVPLTQEIVDSGEFRERMRFRCSVCGDDVEARQEKLDAVLERAYAAPVDLPEPDLDTLREWLSRE